MFIHSIDVIFLFDFLIALIVFDEKKFSKQSTNVTNDCLVANKENKKVQIKLKSKKESLFVLMRIPLTK